jgi:hypothetical protein
MQSEYEKPINKPMSGNNKKKFPSSMSMPVAHVLHAKLIIWNEQTSSLTCEYEVKQ